MKKKILIDLTKLREIKKSDKEAVDTRLQNGSGFKTLKELATFRFTCRRCVDAPCIESCPVDALERDENNVIHRSLNLCVRCKSCIAMCPFGTMSLDLFKVKPEGYSVFDLSSNEDMDKYAKEFPDDVVRITDEEADIKRNIYALSDTVLIKDYAWHN